MDIKEYNVEVAQEKQNHPWEHARFGVVLDIIKSALKKKGNDAVAILDIGCGDAFFLGKLSTHFTNGSFYAVDTALTPELIASFEDKYRGKNIRFYKSMAEVDLSGDRIDVVLLLDVIEHMENDVEFLSTLSSIAGFNSETIVVITVPAYQSLFCAHDRWLGHFRRYSLGLLNVHVGHAGFKVFKSGYFFSSLLIPRLLQKGWEGMGREAVTGIGDWNGGKATAKVVKTVLALDYKLSKVLRKMGVSLPGLSCYCVCKQAQGKEVCS
ncbi:MAG: class I SAM-dependent methyltransferase [Prevotellaceae bacterium]|jgi:SAM-dependent methyltransferase|nr:class I SAM-dependent methyltransferase [Prevotellaceae bacterium]